MSYGFKEIERQIDDARKVQDMSRDPFGSHDGFPRFKRIRNAVDAIMHQMVHKRHQMVHDS